MVLDVEIISDEKFKTTIINTIKDLKKICTSEMNSWRISVEVQKAKQSKIILHIDCRAGKKTIPEMKMSLDESNTRLEAGESLNWKLNQ